MAKMVPIRTFVDYMVWALENKCGYIMASFGQDPKSWSKNSWWFTQYSGSQREKALYWREHAPLVFDCNGIAEGCYLKETGININSRARNNYSEWCTNKGSGRIPAKLRVPGAAVFVHNGSYISHVGYLWKPVTAGKPKGDWWVIEARGVMYGVVKTRLYSRGWNRYGWMTKYYDYDASNEPASEPAGEPKNYQLGERVLQYGSEGEDAKELQTKLLSWGYDLGKWGADGEFGSCTKATVAKFQKDHMLEESGIYDAETHAALVEFAESENGDGDNDTPDPDEDKPDEDKPDEGVTLFPVFRVCPDISKYQGKIDFDEFCAGADFAIFRARVNGNNDSKFETWAAECVKRGFPFSVYDFVTLTDEADAVKQAEAFYKLASPFNPRIYYLDVETLGAGNTCDLHQYTSMGYATPRGANKRVPGAPGIKHRIDLNRLTGNKPLSYFTGREYTANGDTSKSGVGFEYVGIVKITTANTSIRSGAGSQYSKLATAVKGAIFERRPGDTADWYAILYMCQEAFIKKRFYKAMKG